MPRVNCYRPSRGAWRVYGLGSVPPEFTGICRTGHGAPKSGAPQRRSGLRDAGPGGPVSLTLRRLSFGFRPFVSGPEPSDDHTDFVEDVQGQKHQEHGQWIAIRGDEPGDDEAGHHPVHPHLI